MVWKISDPQGAECLKIRYDIVPYTRGDVLDLGCGPVKPWPHFTGVDNEIDTQLFGIQMRPDIKVETCETLPMFADNSRDAIFSSHLLEHIADHEAALKEWWRIIRPGGYLVLYLPHRDLYPRIGTVGANPDHKHDFDNGDITAAMRHVGGWNMLENEVRDEGYEYSLYMVFQKRDDFEQHEITVIRQGAFRPGTALVVRYGAFGDMIQAASIFPQLQSAGFSVDILTSPRGEQICRHDPHLRWIFVQDDDQVSDRELGTVWSAIARRYEKFINLCESVEGTFLPDQKRVAFHWPKALRHELCNKNYLEITAKLAEVAFRPENARFYPDEEEWARIAGELDRGLYNIVWGLSGSSIHKVWPYLDECIRMILDRLPMARIYLTGEPLCYLLEQGWEKEPRVFRRCGTWSIREAMTAAVLANCVVGPETGLLNSVGFIADVKKVLLLSHSSVENLCRDWRNTTALRAEVPCYPCHRMHFSRAFCPSHKLPADTQPWWGNKEIMESVKQHIDKDGMFDTGASACSGAIGPEDVFGAIKDDYERWRAGRLFQAPNERSEAPVLVG